MISTRTVMMLCAATLMIVPTASAGEGCPEPGPLCVDPRVPLQTYANFVFGFADLAADRTAEFIAHFGVLQCQTTIAGHVDVLYGEPNAAGAGIDCVTGEPTLPGPE